MDIFFQAFITLFVVVDPLGTAAVFSSLTKGLDEKATRNIAIKAAVIAIILLLAFGFGGNALLTHLGISEPAFRIAGGLLLFVTAFRMLMGFHDPDHLESEGTTYKDRTDIAIFPLSIPFLAGPGCMTAMMLMMIHAPDFEGKVFASTAMVIVQIIAMICMLGAAKLVKLFGASGSSLLARVMGILMAAMSVQFIADGWRELFLG